MNQLTTASVVAHLSLGLVFVSVSLVASGQSTHHRHSIVLLVNEYVFYLLGDPAEWRSRFYTPWNSIGKKRQIFHRDSVIVQGFSVVYSVTAICPNFLIFMNLGDFHKFGQFLIVIVIAVVAVLVVGFHGVSMENFTCFLHGLS